MRQFISTDQLTEKDIIQLIKQAQKYKLSSPQIDEQMFAANLFFEPSTRTKMSFIVAQRKLGLEILDFNKEISSVQKGESLYDTAKTLESIGANLLVIRDKKDDWMEELKGINIPIINAGAGKAEHPTQSLLDLLTIYEEYGSFKNLNVTIVGDIKYSRVAHSNAKALRRLGANVSLSAPPVFQEDSGDWNNISIDEAVKWSDVLMLLRVQHERHPDKMKKNMTSYLEKYGLTIEREKRMKKHAIILHPAPVNRGVEIDTELVECSKSRIFKQMNNGVYIRMAIITKLLKEWGYINEKTIEKRDTLNGHKRIHTI